MSTTTPPTSTAPTTPDAEGASTEIAVTKVGLVGHCGFDSSSLTRLVRQVAHEAQVMQVSSADAIDKLGPDTLLLVNRTLGGGFSSDQGVDLIRRVAARSDGPRALLISNYEDAQQAAKEAGARPGFGKNDVATPQGEKRLRDAMAKSAESAEGTVNKD